MSNPYTQSPMKIDAQRLNPKIASFLETRTNPPDPISCATLPGNRAALRRRNGPTGGSGAFAAGRGPGSTHKAGTSYHVTSPRTSPRCGRGHPRGRSASPDRPSPGPAGPDGKGVHRRAAVDRRGSGEGGGGRDRPDPPGSVGELPQGAGRNLPADRGEAPRDPRGDGARAVRDRGPEPERVRPGGVAPEGSRVCDGADGSPLPRHRPAQRAPYPAEGAGRLRGAHPPADAVRPGRFPHGDVRD